MRHAYWPQKKQILNVVTFDPKKLRILIGNLIRRVRQVLQKLASKATNYSCDGLHHIDSWPVCSRIC